jgi:hypothetical protein
METALRDLKLAPLSGGADEQLWYSAGFAAGSRRARVWQSAAAGIALLAGASLFWRPVRSPAPHEPVVSTQINHEPNRVVPPERPPDLPPVRPLVAMDQTPDVPISVAQQRLRDAVLERGAEALPATAAGDAGAVHRVWPPSQLTEQTGGPGSWNWTSDRGG